MAPPIQWTYNPVYTGPPAQPEPLRRMDSYCILEPALNGLCFNDYEYSFQTITPDATDLSFVYGVLCYSHPILEGLIAIRIFDSSLYLFCEPYSEFLLIEACESSGIVIADPSSGLPIGNAYLDSIYIPENHYKHDKSKIMVLCITERKSVKKTIEILKSTIPVEYHAFLEKKFYL